MLSKMIPKHSLLTSAKLFYRLLYLSTSCCCVNKCYLGKTVTYGTQNGLFVTGYLTNQAKLATDFLQTCNIDQNYPIETKKNKI